MWEYKKGLNKQGEQLAKPCLAYRTTLARSHFPFPKYSVFALEESDGVALALPILQGSLWTYIETSDAQCCTKRQSHDGNYEPGLSLYF